jgi:GH18 family chitinase
VGSQPLTIFDQNGTDTQHAFGNMAGKSETRMSFILNLAKFMTEYGFDGVDFDW